MCKKDNNPNIHYNPKTRTKFFWSIFVLTVVFGGIQVYNCCKAKDRQDRIFKVLSDSETTLKSQNTSTIDYSDSSVVDSNFLNKRDSLQSSKKDTIVSSGKISKDSELSISQNIRSTIENIEKLLHLEIAKIEEERTSLTLWIGMITVVFLIFSFYSMLKSDDLVKQSQDGLDKIQECNKKVEEIKTTWENKISEVDKELEKKYKSLDIKFEELKNEKKEDIVSYINSRFANNIAIDPNLYTDSSEEKMDNLENDKEDYSPSSESLNSYNNNNSSGIDKTKKDDEQ